MATYGPFTITVTANRAVIINGKTYVKDDEVVLDANEVGPEVPKLITAGYVTSSPAMPTGAAFAAMVASHLDEDAGFPYLGHALAPSIDQQIADAGTYDYVHGLNSLHVGLAGRVEYYVGGATLETIIAPSQTGASVSVRYLVVDDNTIRISNISGGGKAVRARLQAYVIG